MSMARCSRALHAPLGGVQRVVPILRAGRGLLAHDGLGARVRPLHLRSQLGAARVVVESAVDSAPGQPLLDLSARQRTVAVVRQELALRPQVCACPII